MIDPLTFQVGARLARSLLLTGQVTGQTSGSQRLRMKVISTNLANMETTSTPEGGPYRRRAVVFSAAPLKRDFASLLRASAGEALYTVSAKVVVDQSRNPKRVFDPGHPAADASGFVSKPDINLVEEMVEMLSASRSYEANITALNASRDMALKALDIGA